MNKFQQAIVKELKKATKLKEIELSIPPDPKMGDYAFPCFVLAKQKKKNPKEVAEDLAKKLKKPSLITEIKVLGPYVNFFIDKAKLAEDVISSIIKEKENFGKEKNKKQNILVEFFHANTHKGVHIGHVRNISMGESLCRMLEFNGKKVIRVNYFGDIGPHVAKCLWGYMNTKEKEPKEHKGVWLGKLYAIANKKSKESKKIEEEIREINNKLYARDKKLMKIWEKTKQWCYDDFNEIYKVFGFKFDRLYPESECEKPGREIVKQLLKDKIAEESDGAVIVDLKKYDLSVAVLLTKDSNALYMTKDLGLVALKSKEFNIDQSLHVVGSEQELYFKQLFKILELMKHDYAFKSMHLSYGLVMLPEGKMSSREGTMVLYNDLKEKLFKNAEKEIKKRHKGISKKELEKRTEQIAYGALKFGMINREFKKNITFDWDQALDFEGETGPYIQYAHARICSIFRKYGKKLKQADFSLLKTEQELKLIDLLANFPKTVEYCARNHKPSTLCRYLLDLAQAFNEFYHACPILSEEEKLKQARLHLAEAVKQVIKNSLFLLGIEAPEEM